MFEVISESALKKNITLFSEKSNTDIPTKSLLKDDEKKNTNLRSIFNLTI